MEVAVFVAEVHNDGNHGLGEGNVVDEAGHQSGGPQHYDESDGELELLRKLFYQTGVHLH